MAWVVPRGLCLMSAMDSENMKQTITQSNQEFLKTTHKERIENEKNLD